MKIKIKAHPDFFTLFNCSTGTNIVVEKHNLFFYDFGPNLLDVSITNRCNRSCDFCYRKTDVIKTDISLEEYQVILDNAKECMVQQIAIGGGEPTLHPDFCSILKMTRETGIIPNYSTNGDYLTQEVLLQTKTYCGAMAISVYDNITKYESIVKRITELNIRLNLHLILRSDRIEEYIHLLRNPPKWLYRINAIIFLNFKPANGNNSLCFKHCDQKLLCNFFESIPLFDACGIGFDTCSVSFICKYLSVDNSLFDYCEAGRKSAYISEQLYVYPCSFYTKNNDSLRNNSLKNIWNNSETFKTHRNSLRTMSQKCDEMILCHSGCPLYAINLCEQCNKRIDQNMNQSYI